MLIKRAPDIRASEITSKELALSRQELVLSRRKLLTSVPLVGATIFRGRALAGARLTNVKESAFNTTEKVTPYQDVTHYNNYYEFGTSKNAPADLARTLRTSPWTVTV